MSKTVKIFTQAEMVELLQPVIEQSGSTFQKKTKVIAHSAKGGEKIETITSDGKETMNTATKGDYIVQNMTSAGESYIVPADKFEKRYTLIESLGAHESLYQATGRIQAVKLDSTLLKKLEITDSTFQFKAAWGENMVVKKVITWLCPLAQNRKYIGLR